jgi:hypothetical protein
MKTLLLPSRVLLVPVVLALIASLHAQSNATPPALGLLRLKSTAKPNDAAPLAAAKFAVDELSTTGVAGASKAKKNNVDYIALDSGKEAETEGVRRQKEGDRRGHALPITS